MSHTILLIQPNRAAESRTYADYETVNDCMEGICKMYEEHLKHANPNTATITYDIAQLFDFLDTLTDLSCLVFQSQSASYLPKNKEWIKGKIYYLLKKQASMA